MLHFTENKTVQNVDFKTLFSFLFLSFLASQTDAKILPNIPVETEQYILWLGNSVSNQNTPMTIREAAQSLLNQSRNQEAKFDKSPKCHKIFKTKNKSAQLKAKNRDS